MFGARRIGVTLILGIAAVAAIGVPMNALFLQDGRHPAPLFSAQRSNAITVAPTPSDAAGRDRSRANRAGDRHVSARPAPKDAIASKLEKLDAKPLEAGKTEPAKADSTRTDKTRDAIGLLIVGKAPPTASADKADKTEKAASPEKTAPVDKNVLYAQRALLRLGYVVRCGRRSQQRDASRLGEVRTRRRPAGQRPDYAEDSQAACDAFRVGAPLNRSGSTIAPLKR